MRTRIETRVPAALLLAAALGASIPGANANTGSNFGPAVDAACQGFNGTRPFADRSCALCHDMSNVTQEVSPQWSWWRSGDLTNFCPETPPNQAPNGTIDAPATDLVIGIGDSVSFAGSGSDPDGNLPLVFDWHFGGAAGNAMGEDPGSVTFDSAGSFTVTLRVTDSAGAGDPTPATRSISVVNPLPSCTDSDDDGFAREGGSCGPIDCDDANPAVNPDAPEICTDGTDNDCYGLTDAGDPAALEGPVAEACLDNDGDGFSSDGGICGPIDCDDFDVAVNPSAAETCGDNLDNDCDGSIDADDTECDGSDCIARLIGDDTPVVDVRIDKAEWQAERRRLRVEGDRVPGGVAVTIRNAVSGEVLGSATAADDNEWRLDLRLPRDAVPCRVRAAVNGRFDEMNVNDAPRSICGKRDDDDGDEHDGDDDEHDDEPDHEKDGDREDSERDGRDGRCERDDQDDRECEDEKDNDDEARDRRKGRRG